jgi:lipoyl(octanoyl) transferase
VDLGRIHYQSALQHQSQWIERSRSNRKDFEIFCFESEPVITLGLRAQRERDILRQNLLEVLKVDRGGEATYHGPGQLMIFPSLNLPEWNLTVREWVGLLLNVTVELLRRYDIPAEWSESTPGIFTPNGKIASVGLKIRQGWSRHGLALNVAGNTEPFSFIRACGVSEPKIDQMSNWRDSHSLNGHKIGEQWAEIFRRSFS